MGGARNGCASFGRPVTRGCRVACLARGPSQNWGLQPSACTAPWGGRTREGCEVFFPGRMSPEKTDFSWFRRLRPAEVCDACPTGRVRWGGKAGGCLRGCPAGRVRWSGMAGGCLRGVPCRASPLGRKGRRIPMGCALPGESVGAERPADACGACPAGRVRWVGKAGGYLWGVPYRASPLGWRGRRKFATLFGSVVGMVFLQRAHVFVLGKIFLKLPHIWRGSSVIQGERGRSHHGLGGPI